MSKQKTQPDIQALKRFVRALDTLDEPARHAAVAWLADAYLGVKLYGVGKWTMRAPENKP